jgi:hypothetical protein
VARVALAHLVLLAAGDGGVDCVLLGACVRVGMLLHGLGRAVLAGASSKQMLPEACTAGVLVIGHCEAVAGTTGTGGRD